MHSGWGKAQRSARKTADERLAAVKGGEAACFLVVLADALLATGQPHKFGNPLKELARRAPGWREDDCQRICVCVSERTRGAVHILRRTNLQAERQRKAGAEDGDAAKHVEVCEHTQIKA